MDTVKKKLIQILPKVFVVELFLYYRTTDNLQSGMCDSEVATWASDKTVGGWFPHVSEGRFIFSPISLLYCITRYDLTCLKVLNPHSFIYSLIIAEEVPKSKDMVQVIKNTRQKCEIIMLHHKDHHYWTGMYPMADFTPFLSIFSFN